MARSNRKNRAVISGILVGLASIYAVAFHFNLDMATLNNFMLSTLLFFAVIVLLAAVTVLLFKGISTLLRSHKHKDDD
jgi:hypothetical protein